MSIRVRTGYSFRSAVGRLEDVALVLSQNATLPAAPITDTASTFGWVKWAKVCEKKGLRPVFGVELAVTESINEKKPGVDYWTFIAMDSVQPINELVALATDQFRYQPLLTLEQAWSRDDVFQIMGHRTDFSKVPAAAHRYVALSPALAPGQVMRAQSAGHPLVAASDNRFPTMGDMGLYETIVGRGTWKQTFPQWIMSDQEWWDEMEAADADPALLSSSLVHRDFMLKASTATLPKAEMIHPPRPKTLEDWCHERAPAAGIDLNDPVYFARLYKELDLIHNKGFEDYFYLVADICQWARERMIVGPARGSSCGSLVCYLLGITSVDPLPFGLIFERFIDINRSDLTDIDIDFPEDRRAEVFDYIVTKYGAERVARLGTVAMYQPRSSLKEAAGALGVPPWLLNPVMDAIIERSSGDSRALQATEDTLNDTPQGQELLAKHPEIRIAARMEGHPRHGGQHAAGIVITEKPTLEYVAVDQRTGATMCDKKDAETLNLLKIDALGLTQLSIFEHALVLAGLPRDHLFGIPLDDKGAFDVLNSGKYSGIFQFNGIALQTITDQVRIESINDIVAITALARPGPMNTGGTGRWVKVKSGKEKPSYPHPLFKPHLEDTLGVVAYQEQVMTIGREIGGLSWEDVTDLRKAMSKSLGKEFFDRYGDRWKAGARAKGIPEEVLEKVWDDLCAYGSWAFNKSHAVAYGIVSYWCCWLKAHHPLAFAAATLTHTDSPETQIKLLREMAREGVDYVPAHMDHSEATWTVKDGRLIGPLSNVLGIGPKLQGAILSARSRGEALPDRAIKLLTNPKTKIDSLFPVRDAFQRLLPNPAEKKILTAPTPLHKLQPNGEDQEGVVVFCVIQSLKPKDENEAINVAKRNGRRLDGPTEALNLWIADDTDICFAKVGRYEYERIGRAIVDRGRAGKALYALKGRVPKDFRMLQVQQVRYIGDLGGEISEAVE